MDREQFIKNSTQKEIVSKILELKTKPQKKDVTLIIQKLQQQLTDK